MAPVMTTPPPATATAGKLRLRREALARRVEEHSVTEAGMLVRDHGLRVIAGLAGATVSGYLPIRDELNPVPLMTALLAAGRSLALPVIETKWAPLTFRAWRPGDRLIAAEFGLKEPLPASPAVLPDILLVPLAAFDRAGFRIGYGGGYFDRTLALYRAERSVIAIGVAFDCQEVPPFTAEPHDQRLDYLITPSGVREFGT